MLGYFDETKKASNMRTIMFREKHRKRLILLAALVIALLWYYFFGIPGLGGAHQNEIQSHERGNMSGFGRQSGSSNIMDTSGTGSEGLTFTRRQFFLNEKPFRILSGAMHYFRVPHQYWSDRMKKMKACGLNTLETYVAWNLHEPAPGKFNFEGMLNLRKYLELAHAEGLYVILRPGPYICSEWDFGGLPSWLLADKDMKVRSNYKGYQEAITRFLGYLIPQVVHLQYSRGGPIIAVQVENEFGSYSDEVDHLMYIKGIFRLHGIKELLVTSDGPDGLVHAPFYKDALPTVNFKEVEKGSTGFEIIKQENPHFPLMVMEFWTGWFDHWGKPHNTDELSEYAERVSAILDSGASINFYMFHGGTNFGFMAGANKFERYKPDVTSYDYDAPLSEAGDITEKFMKTREIILEKIYKPLGIMSLPPIPPNVPKAQYEPITMEEYMDWKELTSHITKTGHSERVMSMETYRFDSGVGQSYGYIIYRKQCGSGNTLEIPPVHDRAQVLLNTWSVTTFDYDSKSLSVEMHASRPSNLLEIMVENLGRVNFAKYNGPDPEIINKQQKGLDGDVKIDGKFVTDWIALSLDFDEDFLFKVRRASGWKSYVPQKNTPALYRTYLDVPGTPQDTFVNMKDWKKGIVIVNGINLGRYWDIGPQKTLYLPGPFLKTGKNEILVFEEHVSGEQLFFQKDHQLG